MKWNIINETLIIFWLRKIKIQVKNIILLIFKKLNPRYLVSFVRASAEAELRSDSHQKMHFKILNNFSAAMQKLQKLLENFDNVFLSQKL